MKKIKLNLDDLQVESFDTTPEARPEDRGTVFGFTTGSQVICDCDTTPNTCDLNSCDGGGTGDCNSTNEVTCATGSQVICECN